MAEPEPMYGYTDVAKKREPEPEPAHDNEGYHGFEEDWNDHVCVCEHMDTQHYDFGTMPCKKCHCPSFRLGEKVSYAHFT